LHVEPAMGSAERNVTYCSKDDPSPYTWGEITEVYCPTITTCVPDSIMKLTTSPPTVKLDHKGRPLPIFAEDTRMNLFDKYLCDEIMY